jgi:rod shape determining protein RodA
VYLGFLAQLLYLSENARSNFARIYGYGVVGFLFVHLVVNIGMTIGFMPVIGIPLPFFSYGGSALLSFSVMVFILLNFYAQRVNILRSR